MRRHILGILAATIIAPYLMMFLWILFGFALGDRVTVKEPLDLLKAIPMGTFGLMIFGIPLLILAALCARVVNAIRRPTWRGPVLGGIILGLSFSIAFSIGVVAADSEVFAFLMSGACSGAFCGWIYWRIALFRTISL